MPKLKRDVAARPPSASPSSRVPRVLAPLIIALILAAPPGSPAAAQEAAQEAAEDLDQLFEELARPDAHTARTAERIAALWSRSGSPSADLLLRRGRQALEAGDHQAAIDHLTALTDHAPEFAEGWSARATAFYASGRTGEALDDLARALVLEPRHFGALAGLGFILEDLGYQRGALDAYRAVAALHPGIDLVNDAIEHLSRAIEGETL